MARMPLRSPEDGDVGGGAAPAEPLAVDDPVIDAGTPAPVQRTEPARQDPVPVDPIDPVQAPRFDLETPLPDQLPDAIKSLRGKTLKDMVDSYSHLRKALTERADRITEMEAGQVDLEERVRQAELKARGLDDPEAVVKARQRAQEQLRRYEQVVESFIDTGEMDEEFAAQIEQGAGIRVTKDTFRDFLEYQKFARKDMIDKIVGYAEHDEVNVPLVDDVLAWLRSGESPFTADERRGFDRQYRRGNYGWFETVLQEYTEAYPNDPGEAPGRFRATRGQRRPQYGEREPARPGFRQDDMGRSRRGRPIQVSGETAFKSTADFQNQLIAARNDPSLTPHQRREKERALIAKRARQLGEDMPRY